MSIGTINSTSMMQYMQGSQSTQRPDPAQFAQQLFSQIDTSGQGYIDQSELQSAMSTVSLSQSGMTMSSSDLMAKMDTNGDGQVTESEFSNALQSAAQQVGGQHHGHHGHHHMAANSSSGSQNADGDSSSSGGGCGSGQASSGTDSNQALAQFMRLMQAYNVGGSSSSTSANSSLVAVAA